MIGIRTPDVWTFFILPTTTSIFLSSAFIAFIIFLFLRPSRPGVARPVPPGPRGHWLWGNVGLKLEELAPSLFEARVSHGSVFSFELLPGRSLFVVVNEVGLAKEVFLRREFAGRATLDGAVLRIVNPALGGIVNQSWSPIWQKLHRFVTSSLSSLGVGRSRVEARVLAEADALVDAMLERKGAAIDPALFFKDAVSNIVGGVVFGQRKEIGENSELMDNMNNLTSGFFYLCSHPLYNIFPFAMKLFQTHKLRLTIKARDFLQTFVDEQLERHQLKGDDDDGPRDFCDAVLRERLRSPDAPHLSADNIRQTVFDLIIAGTDTTAATLCWCVGYLLRRPDIAATLRREIESVTPSFESLKRCDLLKAFVDEASRLGSVVDFSVHHRPIAAKVSLGGYDVPQDQIVVVNLWGIHHDPELWPEPFEFDPRRFLDENGRYKRNENLMPFGLGQRICIGQRLAMTEIYIFLTRMLQRVNIRLAEGSEMPEMKGRKPGFRLPERFEIVVEPISPENDIRGGEK